VRFIQDLVHYPVLVLILTGVAVKQWKLFATLAITLLAGAAVVGMLFLATR
jgi:hypothetical protein